MQKIIIHLGPHKTATTYFQRVLAANDSVLRAAGIRYLPLDEVRPLITSKLTNRFWGRPSGKQLLALLQPYLDCETLVLFDENFLGGMRPPRRGSLYPRLTRRLAPLAELGETHEVSVHMMLRPMADYLVSRYSEYLRHYRFLDFASYYREIDYAQASWREVIETAHNAFKTPVQLATFKSAVKHPQAYLDFVLGRHLPLDLDITLSASIQRAKISQDAYEQLAHAARIKSPDATPGLMAMLDEAVCQSGHTAKPYQPLSDLKRRSLASAFREDEAFFRQRAWAPLVEISDAA